MNILFIGDSLIKGTVGVNWVKWLATKNPGWTVENAGENGATLSQIKSGLDKKLEKATYDIIFFEGGLNDLLLPALKQKGFLFGLANRLSGKSEPLHEKPADFEKAYRAAIDDIKNKTGATIILSTLGCISENLEFDLNKKRCAYNDVIRDVAIETGCGLVDAGALFDGYLRRCRTKDYFMESFWNAACLDKFQCSVMNCPDHLSKKRGLHLTIDGVHLNSRGANIFRDETERLIKSLVNCCASDRNNNMAVSK